MTEDACIEALRDAPDDAERWAVYADLLQGRGDVRGRLIALAQGKKARAERQLRDKHRKHLASPAFWAILDAGALAADWAFGHLRGVTLELEQEPPRFNPADLDAVLASPLACAVSELTVRLPGESWAASRLLEVLRARQPPLRRLELTAHLTADVLRTEGLLEHLPRVRLARLLGLTSLPPLSSTALESLTARVSDWDGAPPCRLGPLTAPALRELHLRVRPETQPALTRWLREDVRAPGLRRLSLEAWVTSQLFEAVADAPFGASLERLSVLTIDEASAQVLLTRRDAFPKLERLEARFFRTSLALERRVRDAYGG